MSFFSNNSNMTSSATSYIKLSSATESVRTVSIIRLWVIRSVIIIMDMVSARISTLTMPYLIKKLLTCLGCQGSKGMQIFLIPAVSLLCSFFFYWRQEDGRNVYPSIQGFPFTLAWLFSWCAGRRSLPPVSQVSYGKSAATLSSPADPLSCWPV